MLHNIIIIILFNGHVTTDQNQTLKLLNDLSEIRKVSLKDLHSFLTQDHTSFSVLSLSAKHVESTRRLSISLTKNSASSFYLGDQSNSKKSPSGSSVYRSAYGQPVPTDDCVTDAQNCTCFQFFNSAEKKLYTRFKDKVEANFEGTEANGPLLFITLTFNTTQTDYSTWTTNWNSTDACWDSLNQKQSWLKDWAQKFDSRAEPSKTVIQPLSTEVSQHPTANLYLQKFLRRIRLQWKPQCWKWVVVSELQKNGIWHFHLLSTPIVPYSHKCTLDKQFTSCWNCRAYLSTLWPYGRVQSKSPGQQTISTYLAKYLSKSFHLRSLYQQHGLTEKRPAYRFFRNRYEYEELPVLLAGKSKLDQRSGQLLNGRQKVFRRYDYSTGQTSYFYRTSEKLVGHCLKPTLIKKNYRLGTRSLQPLNLLQLTQKQVRPVQIHFTKPSQSGTLAKDPADSLRSPSYSSDFQEHLLTSLLFFCETAQFIQLPLEQEQVPKELGCNQNIHSHFKAKPLLHFTFAPATVPLVLQFLDQLDQLAKQFDTETSENFYLWPPHHDQNHQTLRELGSLCGCEITARNTYLNYWTHLAADHNSYFIQGRTVR